MQYLAKFSRSVGPLQKYLSLFISMYICKQRKHRQLKTLNFIFCLLAVMHPSDGEVSTRDSMFKL